MVLGMIYENYSRLTDMERDERFLVKFRNPLKTEEKNEYVQIITNYRYDVRNYLDIFKRVFAGKSNELFLRDTFVFVTDDPEAKKDVFILKYHSSDGSSVSVKSESECIQRDIKTTLFNNVFKNKMKRFIIKDVSVSSAS